MNFVITHSLAQAILDYLAERPYKEVVHLISGLTQIKSIEESEEPDDDVL